MTEIPAGDSSSVVCSNIKWDTTDDSSEMDIDQFMLQYELPDSLVIVYDPANPPEEEDLADMLSDHTGYAVISFEL